jgi:hypothetical protein
MYATVEGWKEKSMDFYELIQFHINSVNRSDHLTICGDFNAWAEKQWIQTILGNMEKSLKTLLCLMNWRLQTIFIFVFIFIYIFFSLSLSPPLSHKDIHKYLWSTRSFRSIIDYVSTNPKLLSQVRSRRVEVIYDVHFDNFFLVMSMVNIPANWIQKERKTSLEVRNCYKVHLLQQGCIRKIYYTLLKSHLD